eukprot:SM000033S12353  [mRNA]  locus=s33:298349:300108:- [translate_table: standard]
MAVALQDQFYEFLMIEATRRELRTIIENKNRIILAHSSSGYKHSLKEVLAEPAVLAQVKDTKAAKEDPARAFYGPGHVEAAHERLAIQTLLITDELFSPPPFVKRQRCMATEQVARLLDSSASFCTKGLSVTAVALFEGEEIANHDGLRNANLTERRRWVNLVEAVKADGGHVHVFSSMHVSGEQLRQLTGVAAILRFPLPDLEDMEL